MLSKTDQQAMARRKKANLERRKKKHVNRRPPRPVGSPARKPRTEKVVNLRDEVLKNYLRILHNVDLGDREIELYMEVVAALQSGDSPSDELLQAAFRETESILYSIGLTDKKRYLS